MPRHFARTVMAHFAWVAVGLFWFFTTRGFHPTSQLAVIVTSSLIIAFAIATDVNHFLLIPRLRHSRRLGRYFLALFGVMAACTALALTVIRIAYFQLHGPDVDPYGMYKHFVIDLFGAAVHVSIAAGMISLWQRLTDANRN